MSATRPALDRQAREAFADTLSEYNTQRAWYSKRAGDFKSRAQRLDLVIILCGALIAAVPILKPGGAAHWTQILAAFLGAGVVIAQGAQRVYRYAEIWPEYRVASEKMKREWRMFINDAEPYDAAPDADALYVARLEQIIAQEQKIFFEQQRQSSEPDKDSG